MRTNLQRQALRRCIHRLSSTAWIAVVLTNHAAAQKTLTWEDAKRQLDASNPNLHAAQIEIQQAKADEITAYLRPNPDLTIVGDQFDPITTNPFRPFSGGIIWVQSSYLIERQH